ncbi:MAG: succinate dehydrogenase, cytochrome b556 subunit [Maritimibacter sp.]
MADMNTSNRPLSPHVSIYRWPLNAIMSIMHRATGVAMSLAAILIVWWLLAAATGPEYFATANGFLTSWFGDLVLFLSMLALWFHFANGVRHLIWDTGSSFGRKRVYRSGIAGLIAAAVLSVITLIIA